MAIAEGITKTNDKDGLASSVEMVLGLLLTLGLAYYARIPPKRVGVHPSNRYGLGVVASWMHSLGAKIVRMGWSWHACSGAVCIEDDMARSTATYTRALQRSSELFGDSSDTEIGYGSVASGHTNQFLVGALSGVPCEEEGISVDGRMSKSKIIGLRPGMEDVLDNGIKWLVVKKEAIELFPELPNCIQAARQAIGQVQHGEGVFELLESIQSLVSSSPANQKDWAAIQKRVAMSESGFAAEIPTFCDYVRLYGGGHRGQFVKRLLRFVRICVPDNQYIGASTFQAITGLKLKSGDFCPNVMTAILQAQAKCPHKYVKSHVCKYINESEISGLGQRVDEVHSAESILVAVWKAAIVIESRMPAAEFVKIMGRFDCLVARVLFSKALPDDIKTFENCAAQALQELQTNCPDVDIENPWIDHMPQAADVKDERATAELLSNAFEYDDDGKICSVNKIELVSKGFVVDARVKNPSGNMFKIETITDNGLVYIRPLKEDGGFEKKWCDRRSMHSSRSTP